MGADDGCGSALLICHASSSSQAPYHSLCRLRQSEFTPLLVLSPEKRFALSRGPLVWTGRLPFVSGWSAGRPAALRSPSLRSIRAAHNGSALLTCHALHPPRRRISRTTAAKPIRGYAPPWAFASAPVLSACSRVFSASYLISLLVLPARNWVTSAVLFSSLYRPGTAAYRAAQVTRSCFQVISLGAWAWLSAPGPKPTQGMP